MTNRSRHGLLCILTMIASARGGAQAAPNTEQEMERVRGTFSLIAGVADGAAMPSLMASGMKRVAEGNVTTITMTGML